MPRNPGYLAPESVPPGPEFSTSSYPSTYSVSCLSLNAP